MTAKEIITRLQEEGFKVSKPESFYIAGAGYPTKYTIVGSKEVDGYDGYFPVKVKSEGFIFNKGNLMNFYTHNGKGFDILYDVNEFITRLKKTSQTK